MSGENTSRKNAHGTFISVFARALIYGAIVAVLIQGVTVFYRFGYDIFYASSVDPPPGRNVKVNITEDMNFETLSKLLYDEGIIENEYAFRIQAGFFSFRLNPGEYTFNTSQTSREILEMIDDGMLENSRNDNRS